MLALKDLRVTPHGTGLRNLKLAELRPASLADLVEVLKQEGAVEVEARKQLREGRFDWLMLAPKQGRYLVLPLGDTPK